MRAVVISTSSLAANQQIKIARSRRSVLQCRGAACGLLAHLDQLLTNDLRNLCRQANGKLCQKPHVEN
jgi:hypothetical protein